MGDPAAFAALVRVARPQVEAVVRRILPRDEAEDVVQEALLRAYLGLSSLRDPERFTGWLCGIALNLAKMRLRRRALERRVAAAGGGGSEAAVDVEVLDVVRRAVELLPPGQRDVVLMHYVDDLSCEEIARLLGTSPGAVRVRLHRARAQLRQELAPLAPVPLETTKEERMVPVRVEDVIVRVAVDDPSQLVAEQRIVLLREEEGERVLPIWIGPAEGNALAYRLSGDSPPRPMTSDLMVELLRATGARVERVGVTALRESTFFGSITLVVDGGTEEVDARPSDALNLAVRVDAPVFVDAQVMEEWAVPSQREVESRLTECGGPHKERLPNREPPTGWRSLTSAVAAAPSQPSK
jgi:RNA polymerase sigma factor (sigma-70 family)